MSAGVYIIHQVKKRCKETEHISANCGKKWKRSGLFVCFQTTIMVSCGHK